MRNQSTPNPVEDVSADTLALCDCCRTIPLTHLSLDLSTPRGGWEAMLEVRGVELVVDDLGRSAIPREVLGELIAERAAADGARAADNERRVEELARKRPARPGIRFDPETMSGDLSPYQLMRLADADADTKDPNRRVSPTEEIFSERFGKPRKIEVKREDG